MEEQDNSRVRFNLRVLPWIVAAGALVLYLITLNRWITLGSLNTVAKVTGWDWWSLSLSAPLFYLLTWPVRWLPAAWQPLALNILSAVCSAAALGLLARSVALLPHDRTREQRQRIQNDHALLSMASSWLPPVFAALVCGLQLTFWEHATAATGEALNLLLFAYILRGLLEYRVDGDETRLTRMAFVYGLSVTNNWAMIGFFPAFLVALVWIQKMRFFNGAHLARMLGCGLLGLTLYLLPPILEKSGNGADMTFWELMRTQLGMQKNILLVYPKYVLMLCSLSSLLPVFLIGFRLPSNFGDTSIVGSFMTNFMYRIIQTAFLAFCLWVAFDPPISPRALSFGFAFLPSYYLGALCIGYFSGYFLLVCGVEPEKRFHRAPPGSGLLNQGMVGLICLAAVGVPLALAIRNLPGIRSQNHPHLAQFASRLVENLPQKGAIVLSDDPIHLMLIEAISAQRGIQHRNLLLDTRSLPYSVYQHNLAKRYPGVWPDLLKGAETTQPINHTLLLQVMCALSRTNEIYYAHPSYGYYGEGLMSESRGLVFAMKPYKAYTVTNLPPTAEAVAKGLEYWKKAKAEFDSTPRSVSREEQPFNRSASEYMGVQYSLRLNHWGVELQQHGFTAEAGQCFDLAREFNPENWVAWVNQEFNKNLRAGNMKPVEIPPATEPKVRSKYQRWEDRLSENGPFDEPRFCAEMGENFATTKPQLIRHAAQQFLRVLQLDASNMDAVVWLGNMYLKWPFPNMALALVEETEARQGRQSLSLPHQIEFLRLKAWSLFMQTNQPRAIQLLKEAQAGNPGVPGIPETLVQLYVRMYDYTNALAAVEDQLRIDGNDPKALLNQGALCIQLGRFEEAIGPLTKVLQNEPKNDAARLNRAIANLRAGHLEAAEGDYQIALDIVPKDKRHRVYYGLGETAWQRKDNDNAARYYQKYLDLVPRRPQGGAQEPEEEPLMRIVLERMKQFGAAPSK